MLNITRRLASALVQVDDPYARQLDASVFRLDRCLIEIRKSSKPPTSLLWIDDVTAALESVLRHLSSLYHARKLHQKSYPNYSTTITSSSNDTPFDSSMSPIRADPQTEQAHHSARIHHHSYRPRQSNTLFDSQRRHTHIGSTFTRPRRRSLASLFAQPPPRSTNRMSNVSRSNPSSVNNHPFSERLFSSFARLVSPVPTSEKSTPSSNTFLVASRTVDEWVAAVRAAKDDRTLDDTDSCISLSDALPPLPQHYLPCRDAVYHAARDALLKASVRPPPSSSSSSISAATAVGPQQPTATVALLGPHGVGKTMLAMELVHDVDICHNFADGVAWIQLGSDITDEELAENLIHCVDTIIAGDFRSSVRYCHSLEGIVSRASRLLRHVSSLVVIDDVNGSRAQRAFDIVASALGPSCVILYTAPLDEEGEEGAHTGANQPSSESITCISKLHVRRLDPSGQEALAVFRNWLTKSASDESRDGSLKHATDQNAIISRCHGLPLALAMAGGFLSKFHNSWNALSAALSASSSADETIFRIMRLLHVKGGARFEQQLKAIGSLPHGMWVSLSALADLWGTDYRTIKLSARRLGRMAFGEYRLSDTSDESRVRFHWHVFDYCSRMTSLEDEREANRRLLTNLSRRRSTSTKARSKIEYLPWWSSVVSDKYLCRRLHWHIARGDTLHTLNDLICDYQWVCQRLESDSLLGMMTEFKLAMLAEDRDGREDEFSGIARIATAIQEASKLRQNEAIEMNALPTFLTLLLRNYGERSECVQKFLSSMYDKARRPWLMPKAEAEATAEMSIVETSSSESTENEMPYMTNCLTSTSCGKVVCGDGAGNVHVYDPVTCKKVVSWSGSCVGGNERWRGVGALGAVEGLVISGHYNGRLLLRSIRSGRTELLEDYEADGERFTCIGTSEVGVVAVGSHNGTLFVLKGVQDYSGNIKHINLQGHCHMVMALYVFPDGDRIASSSYDGFAAIWRLKGNGKHERISLNGHKPEIGHKENYITTFATVGGGKRLLSSCRGGVVSAWNSATGDCVWTRRYGYEFSRSSALQAFGIRQFSGRMKVDEDGLMSVNDLRVGYPYVITRGEGPRDLIILAAGEGREIVATVTTDQVISTWLEVWHPSSRRIFVAVSHSDGRLCCYELVTSLR